MQKELFFLKNCLDFWGRIEHNKHSKILHRYTKTTEISDRNNGFAKFRSDWWKNRVGDCKRKSF